MAGVSEADIERIVLEEASKEQPDLVDHDFPLSRDQELGQPDIVDHDFPANPEAIGRFRILAPSRVRVLGGIATGPLEPPRPAA